MKILEFLKYFKSHISELAEELSDLFLTAAWTAIFSAVLSILLYAQFIQR